MSTREIVHDNYLFVSAKMEFMKPLPKHCRAVTRFFVACVLGIGLIISLDECFKFYWLSPTYTDIALVDQHKAQFPALTFCPDTKEKIKEDVLKV